MLVPLKWLRDYVNDGLSTQELAKRLTASGSSVEKIIEVGSGLDDLIVGEVLSVKPHPNADRLRLATVNTGQETVEVVCGAPNLAAGQHIAYAAAGSTIPVNMHDEDRKPFTLKKAKIRGVESNGMICSVAEMGIGEDHDGILVLPTDTQIGQSVATALEYPQTVFDIEVTTNRSDELSLLGIAREVSVLTATPLQEPATTAPTPQIEASYEPVITTEACYRLMTQQLDVTVGPSPWWMQQYLSLAGMRPINNVVDITNFVMLELGQPLHAYDAAQLTGQQLIARQASPGEILTTLDGMERTLQSHMMVIADESKPLGVAGIKGGESSMIGDTTKTIVLEAAAFDPVSIRQTANALALRSEASRRYERTVNREMTEAALNRAVALMIEYAGGKKVGKRRNNYPSPLETKQITLTSRKLYQYLGREIDPLEVRRVLKSLGFGDTSAFGKDKDWEIAAKVPSWRSSDVHEEVDLIEEVVRIIGYQSVPISLPSGQLPSTAPNHEFKNRSKLRQRLAECGWSEAITLSLTGQDAVAQAGTELPGIALANPLSSEWTHMRSSLLPGLLQVAKKNIRPSNQNLQLFEIGNTYQINEAGLPIQECHLGLVLSDQQPAELNVGRIKGIVEMALGQLGITKNMVSYHPAEQSEGVFDRQNSVGIAIGGQMCGQLGALPIAVRESLDLPTGTLLAELAIDTWLQSASNQSFSNPPKHPSLEEDLSLLVNENRPVAEVLSLINDHGGDILESVELKEVYRHESLGQQVKSPVVHLIFRATDRTLSTKEVAKVRNNIISALQEDDIHVRE